MNTEVKTEQTQQVGFSFQTPKKFKIDFDNYLNEQEKLLEDVGIEAFREYLALHPQQMPAADRDILNELKDANKDPQGINRGLSTVFFRGPADLHQEVHIYRARNTITLKDLGAIVLYAYMQRHR